MYMKCVKTMDHFTVIQLCTDSRTVVTLAHAQIVHVLIVFCVHSLHPTVSSCSAWVHKAAAWLH